MSIHLEILLEGLFLVFLYVFAYSLPSGVGFYVTSSVYCRSNPLLPFSSRHLPSDNHHTAVYVHKFQLYIQHMREIIPFLAFLDWLISLIIMFSRCIHVFANGTILSFLMAKWVIFHYIYHISLSSPLSLDTSVVSKSCKLE